jgi:hypothetical protein
MIETYRITRRYYQDHVDCGCEAPAIIKSTKQHLFISAEETEGLAELRSRARHYVEMGAMGAFDDGFTGLVSSARATLKVIGAKPGEGFATYLQKN